MDPADLFPTLHGLRDTHQPFGPLVDEVSLLIAQRTRSRLSQGLGIHLSWDKWTQLTAIIQTDVAVALRHAAFDKPDFPANRYEEGT